MSKYKVGDTVTVTCKVVAVHEQGYPLGALKNGMPRMPEKHEDMSLEDLKPYQTEQPDVVIAELPSEFEANAHGQLHFKAPAA